MTIGGAVEAMRTGRRVRRTSWGKWETLIAIRMDREESLDVGGRKLRWDPVVIMKLDTETGFMRPWEPDQNDVMAEDWEVVHEQR